MPQNKRESLVYSVIMCFCMVLWMSIYNVALQHGGLSLEVVQQAWLGFPIAYIFAFCCDWFFVSKLAKGVAFGFLLRPDSSVRRKVITISSCMVVPMVLIMSLHNIPFNFIMALPFQLIIAGPLVRFVFRKAFPVGTIAA